MQFSKMTHACKMYQHFSKMSFVHKYIYINIYENVLACVHFKGINSGKIWPLNGNILVWNYMKLIL